jgi:hypothetical protein
MSAVIDGRTLRSGMLRSASETHFPAGKEPRTIPTFIYNVIKAHAAYARAAERTIPARAINRNTSLLNSGTPRVRASLMSAVSPRDPIGAADVWRARLITYALFCRGMIVPAACGISPARAPIKMPGACRISFESRYFGPADCTSRRDTTPCKRKQKR